jgi:hypothetical protein
MHRRPAGSASSHARRRTRRAPATPDRSYLARAQPLMLRALPQTFRRLKRFVGLRVWRTTPGRLDAGYDSCCWFAPS